MIMNVVFGLVVVVGFAAFFTILYTWILMKIKKFNVNKKNFLIL